MIYRTMVFGHRKCFGGYRVHIGSPEGVPGTPAKRYGPYGPREETHQPQGEGCSHASGLFSPFPYGPLRPNTNSRSSPVLRKIPESLGTFPKSEYSLPIYQSLRLDHFETPRHIPDLIWDSELLRYINIHKLIIKLSS